MRLVQNIFAVYTMLTQYTLLTNGMLCMAQKGLFDIHVSFKLKTIEATERRLKEATNSNFNLCEENLGMMWPTESSALIPVHVQYGDL